MGQHTEILKKFDKDGDKKLNQAERKEAREFLAKEGNNRRRGFGGPGGGTISLKNFADQRRAYLLKGGM